MPQYDFRCDRCDAVRGVLASYERSRALELICTECGGTMRVSPVLSVNIGAFFAERVEDNGKQMATAKSCGHSYACRCGAVKLTRPNPFKAESKNGA